MKKIILSALAVIAFGQSYGQTIKTDAGTFAKPKAGDIIFEVNFAPDLTGKGLFSLPTLSSDLGLVGVKARKFVSDTKAYRGTANLSILDSGVEGTDTNFTIGAGFGVEHHLKGAERLSTYWGYEGKFGYVTGSENFTEEDYYGDSYSYSEKVSKFGLGANVFTGFDYYIIPNVYLGVEISYGMAIANISPEEGDSITKFELAPGISPSFRLGWRL
jgi:hypothetical protein